MKLHGPDEPVYTIGVVARLLGVSAQTLRLFEREGLVEPARTEANIRLYSQNELIHLRRVCELVRVEGVNIAGVRTVLRIERRYEQILGPSAEEEYRPAGGEAQGRSGDGGGAGGKPGGGRDGGGDAGRARFPR
ncbi:MAG: MerR family transcriptional regulator [Bacillota bacterium]|nr:MerR family transcriptional regulator [Bacillota bacterium]